MSTNSASVWFSVESNPDQDFHRILVTLNGSSTFDGSNVSFYGVPAYVPGSEYNFGASSILGPPANIDFEGVFQNVLGQFIVNFDDAVTGTITIGAPLTVPLKAYPISGATGFLTMEPGQTSADFNFPAQSGAAAPQLLSLDEALKQLR
ncbi:MAG TPA: hypothetical protein VFN10_15290 [Thermoanaerobaculia bacterium]|nr:hypothetical protein [Thermoanaerobaculia bacterium]